ncbi:MAG: hypothetical protein ACE14V_08700 [bacterium]
MKTKFSCIAIIIIFSWLLSGCATTRYTGSRIDLVPTVPFDVKVTKAVNKEIQDYYRSKRVGFNEVGVDYRMGTPIKFVDLSPDQRKIIDLIGLPEYQRAFPNKTGKRVVEWVYLNQDYLVQFIYGNLVYLGPVDDLEKTLIENGSPNEIYFFDFAGMQKVIFKYSVRRQIYAFQDDRLIVVQ